MWDEIKKLGKSVGNSVSGLANAPKDVGGAIRSGFSGASTHNAFGSDPTQPFPGYNNVYNEWNRHWDKVSQDDKNTIGLLTGVGGTNVASPFYLAENPDQAKFLARRPKEWATLAINDPSLSQSRSQKRVPGTKGYKANEKQKNKDATNRAREVMMLASSMGLRGGAAVGAGTGASADYLAQMREYEDQVARQQDQEAMQTLQSLFMLLGYL